MQKNDSEISGATKDSVNNGYCPSNRFPRETSSNTFEGILEDADNTIKIPFYANILDDDIVSCVFNSELTINNVYIINILSEILTVNSSQLEEILNSRKIPQINTILDEYYKYMNLFIIIKNHKFVYHAIKNERGLSIKQYPYHPVSDCPDFIALFL